jgi:hypothetical protein
MKIGIFAADKVGLKIVSLFSKLNKEIMFLVLDEKENNDLNDQIKNTVRCKNIFFLSLIPNSSGEFPVKKCL